MVDKNRMREELIKHGMNDAQLRIMMEVYEAVEKKEFLAQLPEQGITFSDLQMFLSKNYGPNQRISAKVLSTYTRDGLIPPGEGDSKTRKRYSRKHILRLYTVNMLKSMMSLGEIKTMIDTLKLDDEKNAVEFYDLLRDWSETAKRTNPVKQVESDEDIIVLIQKMIEGNVAKDILTTHLEELNVGSVQKEAIVKNTVARYSVEFKAIKTMEWYLKTETEVLEAALSLTKVVGSGQAYRVSDNETGQVVVEGEGPAND